MAEKDGSDSLMGSSGGEKMTESFSKDLMVTMTTIEAGHESAVQWEDDTPSPPRSSPSPTNANQSEPALSSEEEEEGSMCAALPLKTGRETAGDCHGEHLPVTLDISEKHLQSSRICEEEMCSGGVTEEVTGGAIGSQCYLVRWITWKDKKTPIVTQSQNGACPLLAIINTLLLRWKATLPAQTEVVTSEDLMAHLGECVLSVTPREKTEGMELNLQQNISDVMSVLPKLSTGLDVNVRFTGVTDFEYTPECIVFDLLDIPLYHGWLVDPQSVEAAAAVGKLSYNQLVEKIINNKLCADSSRIAEGLIAEHFLESTATQLSYHGLCELNSTASEGEISVFFRNNHFSTMIKHKGQLYLLVTDQGFLHEEGFVWESLHNVEGDGNFCDSNFRLQTPPPQRSTNQQQDEAQRAQSDLELARQLQQEEYQHTAIQQGVTQQVRGQRSQQVRRRDSDCVLL